MRHRIISYLVYACSCLPVAGCKSKPVVDAFHFTQMPGSQTGITFNNQITETDSINVYTNEYMYNGSGVGIADFNGDGLQDVFFGGSMVSSRLYLNKGGFGFTDVTQAAGVSTSRWCTGISIADVNADGAPDIYISASHSPVAEQRKNLLFINNGKAQFTEEAAVYGLADTGFSSQAAFLDYDKDGDLDMYLLRHRLYNASANTLVSRDTSGANPATDKLYRNDGVPAGGSHPVFSDVSIKAGIKEDGYGLGLVVTDVNNDNWPDVYVANDYIGNDVLWLNNKAGGFSNVAAAAVKHQSYNSMGVDAADVNNDGLPDLAVVDMMPENTERKKMMFNAASQEKYDMGLRLGYEPAFVRNMLQLNNGTRPVGEKQLPFYSEVGQVAGMAETDWSWSVLMADFDNDGWKDMHITNGLARDVTNNDFAAFKNNVTQTAYSFNAVAAPSGYDAKTIALLRQNLAQYESISIPNYFYHNNGGYTFTNTTTGAGLSTPSVSNGAAWADLDNDGDLDLVVNNMNSEAFVWRNNRRNSADSSSANYLRLTLQGPAGNGSGYGARVWVYTGSSVQLVEQWPVRGYASSVDPRLHVGLGKSKSADSVKIQWPDDKVQVLKTVAANQQLILRHADAATGQWEDEQPQTTFFAALPVDSAAGFTHTESEYFDFNTRRPMPQKYSQLGPCIATGDVNGDGLTDYFIGGAANQWGAVALQQNDGSFKTAPLGTGPKPGEDLGALLFDADNDTDLDLLVTGGSAEFSSTVLNAPTLFKNNGKGRFLADANALPKGITDVTKEAVAADYDADGDMDVFIGGRLLPQRYPAAPRSYVLQNNGGVFTDVTAALCKALLNPGLVTGAVFTDFSGDGKPDLALCGEWMEPRFFKNNGAGFTEVTAQTGLKNGHGQWRCLKAGDVDGDGDTDLVAGNLGLNNRFHPTAERPLKLYAADFIGNGSYEIIPAYYQKNNSGAFGLYPALDRQQLADQIPSVKKAYLLSADYAPVTMAQLLTKLSAKTIQQETCETTASVWLENGGSGRFTAHPLPVEAQLSPVNSIVLLDADNDGIKDLLLGGNEYGTEFMTGRYDASYGVFLHGEGKGRLKAISPLKSGFMLDGDVRSLQTIATKKGRLILAAINNKAFQQFNLQKQRIDK